MKSYLPVRAVVMNIRHRQVVYGIADLAERLRRTLKARVRKSVGSIPTDCNDTFLSFSFLLLSCTLLFGAAPGMIMRPRIAQLAERETVDGYN